MPTFQDHINQATHNLLFFENVNKTLPNYTDWQVTACFYSALHLVNAHLSKYGLQYRSHNDVKNALNPENMTSVTRLPPDEYVAYVTLQMLSRRSRYLVNEKDRQLKEEKAHFTYDKHLAKAIIHLDHLTYYFHELYKLDIGTIELSCNAISLSTSLKIFKRKQ